jgi:hypothetical protein
LTNFDAKKNGSALQRASNRLPANHDPKPVWINIVGACRVQLTVLGCPEDRH